MLSPAAHAGRPSCNNNSTSETEFVKPSGEAEETLAQVTALSNQLAAQKTPQGEVVGVNCNDNGKLSSSK